MIEYTEVGYLKKTHGLKGYVHIDIKPQYEDDVLQANALFIERRKKKSPYFIVDFELGGKDLVRFEEFNTPEEAKAITQSIIFLRSEDIENVEAKHEYDNEDDLQYGYLANYTLFDQHNTSIGVIMEILSLPQQEMAVVNYKEKEILIPLNETAIQKEDALSKTVHVELIEGILDL